MKKKYDIEVDCANCAAKIEAAVKRSSTISGKLDRIELPEAEGEQIVDSSSNLIE